MNTNNSFGDKAPFVAICTKSDGTNSFRRTFWSLDLSHAKRAAKALAKKHGYTVLLVVHAQESGTVIEIRKRAE